VVKEFPDLSRSEIDGYIAGNEAAVVDVGRGARRRQPVLIARAQRTECRWDVPGSRRRRDQPPVHRVFLGGARQAFSGVP
jgi:hypothetical protein